MKSVCSRLLVRQKDGQNGFLDVEAVLSFGEDLVGVLFKDRRGDLLAAVGGQAVEEHRVGLCSAQQATRDLKSRRRRSLSGVPGAVFQAAVTTTSASFTPSAGSVRRWNFGPYLWANISTSAAGR